MSTYKTQTHFFTVHQKALTKRGMVQIHINHTEKLIHHGTGLPRTAKDHNIKKVDLPSSIVIILAVVTMVPYRTQHSCDPMQRFNKLEHGALSCDHVRVWIFGRTWLHIVHWPHSRCRSRGGCYSSPLLLLLLFLWLRRWQLVWRRNLELQRRGRGRPRPSHGLQFPVPSLLESHMTGILIHRTVLQCTVPRDDREQQCL